VVSQVEKIVANTTERMTKFETDMKAANDDINARIAKLTTTTPATPTHAAAAGRAASSTAPASSSATVAPGGYRPTRIWLKGFRETLTSKFLNEYSKNALARISPDLSAGAKPGAPGFGAVVYIDYPPGTLMNPIRKALTDLQLVHKDEAGTEHPIRVATDQPLAVRHKGRLLGELWKLVEPHLANLPSDSRPRNFKLGTSNGKLFLVVSDRPVELFSTTMDDQGNLTVHMNEKNSPKYGITESMAQSWITTATRAAERAGQ
jgi:hypothetical protein